MALSSVYIRRQAKRRNGPDFGRSIHLLCPLHDIYQQYLFNMKGQLAFAALAGVVAAAPSAANDGPTALSDNYSVRMYSNGTLTYGGYEERKCTR